MTKPKIEYKEDTKIAYAGTFTVNYEDHTIGNLMKNQLLADKQNVVFAGYKKPHPLENCVMVKVQTIAEKHPQDVFKNALSSLIEVNNSLRKQFKEGMSKRYFSEA